MPGDDAESNYNGGKSINQVVTVKGYCDNCLCEDCVHERDTKIWPFNWDWDFLLPCTSVGFPLLDCPVPVLLEIMRKLERADRMALSHTSQKLRTLILKNQTPSMDRRKIFDKVSPVIVHLDPLYNNGVIDGAEITHFPHLSAMEKHVKSLGTVMFFPEVRISMNPTISGWGEVEQQHFDLLLPKWIKIWSRMAELILVRLRNDAPLSLMHPLLTAFKEYPEFKVIQLSSPPCFDSRWDFFCTTVTTWAGENRMEVKRTRDRYCYWQFCKEDGENGVKTIVVNTPLTYGR